MDRDFSGVERLYGSVVSVRVQRSAHGGAKCRDSRPVIDTVALLALNAHTYEVTGAYLLVLLRSFRCILQFARLEASEHLRGISLIHNAQICLEYTDLPLSFC